MLRIEGPTLPPESVGQYVPLLFGSVYGAAAIPISVGQVDTLALAIPSSGAQASISVSSAPAFESCPDAGVLQIDQERFTYTGRNVAGLYFTGITRAVQGTASAAHALGATVYQIPTEALYVVAHNPNGHYTSAVTSVKLNGRVKLAAAAPTHVLTLDDTTVFPGESVVSLRFDLSTLPPVAVTTTSTHHFTGIGAAGSNTYGQPAYQSQGLGTYTTTSTVYEYPPPLLGQITVDAIGLLDDASGTITGTPSLLIERPAHVTKLLMREAYQERDAARYDGTWATTHTLQVADDMAWALRFLPMPFDAFRRLVGTHGLAEVVWDPDVWRYLPRQVLANRTPSYTLDARSLLATPALAWTPSTDLITVLQVTYGQVPYQRNFTLTSAYQPRYGGRPGLLELPWLAAPNDPAVTTVSTVRAQRLARYWLSQWERPRLTGTLTAGWEGLALELTDLVTFNPAGGVLPTGTPNLMDLYGALALAFEVRGMRHRVDERLIDLIIAETDPWALRLRSGYAIASNAAAAKLVSGYAVVSTALSVSDTVAVSATEAAVTAGFVRVTETLPLTISDPTPVVV